MFTTFLGVIGALALLILAGGAMLTPTNRYFNSSSWSFTPSGGSATNFTGITSASYDEGISTKKEGADFDLFPTVSVADWRDPKVTLEMLDSQAGVTALIAGVKGQLIGTIRDAYNGASTGGGAKIYTFSNAQIEGRNFASPYREYSKQTLVFGAISADGSTHPMAISAA